MSPPKRSVASVRCPDCDAAWTIRGRLERYGWSADRTIFIADRVEDWACPRCPPLQPGVHRTGKVHDVDGKGWPVHPRDLGPAPDR